MLSCTCVRINTAIQDRHCGFMLILSCIQGIHVVTVKCVTTLGPVDPGCLLILFLYPYIWSLRLKRVP
ncbi:hypothetical protein BD408DRAFT_418703 [Parasitella parasitica]|nr:hypothetical protein BD408DRAFT_418703 [Parasitella parasitica]